MLSSCQTMHNQSNAMRIGREAANLRFLQVWLIEFMNGCLFFNILSFVCYCVVNYGLQQDAQLQVCRHVQKASYSY